jgi:hypothetical protein
MNLDWWIACLPVGREITQLKAKDFEILRSIVLFL